MEACASQLFDLFLTSVSLLKTEPLFTNFTPRVGSKN
jgi:hypothetical protein